MVRSKCEPNHTSGSLSALPSSREQEQLAANLNQEEIGPRYWSQSYGKVARQLSGLDPFKSSYLALYRPLRSIQSKALLALAIVLSLAAGAPLPIIGLLFSKMIDRFPLPEDELQTRLGQLMATACVYFATTWGWSVCWGIVGQRVSKQLREQSLKRLLEMEQAYFDTEHPDVTGVLTEKVQVVHLGTSEKVGLFLQSIAYFIAAFAVGFSLQAKLAGILLATVIPAMVAVISLGTTFSSRFAKRAAEYSKNATSFAENLIAGVKTIQATGSFETLSRQYQDILECMIRWGTYKAGAGAAMLGSVFFIAYAANALAFYVGSREIGENETTGAGSVYAVVFLILDASFVVGQFGPFIQSFALAAAAGESIFAIIDRDDCSIDIASEKGQPITHADFKEDLEFMNVDFRYPSRQDSLALDRLNLTIKSGATNGIVGASGSGKSTITQLLLRFYDPSSGLVCLGDRDVRGFNLKSWRANIALVGQEPVLFDGSILDNILAGIPPAHRGCQTSMREKCIAAARDAGCEEFVLAFPDTYDTRIGAVGVTNLSGGQKQRIALARAIVSDPALLILDEYTSALDARSESFVLQRLQTNATDRTVLIIAHRLATVKDCEQITVMHDGVVVEQGSHADLIEKNEAYRALIDAQSFGDVEEVADAVSDVNTAHKASGSVSLRKQSSPSGATEVAGETELTQSLDQNASLGLAKTLLRLILIGKSNIPFMLLGLFAAALGGCTLIGEAVVFGNLISILSAESIDNSRANFFCLMFFIIALVALIAHCVSGFSFGIVSERLVSTIQSLALRTVLSQDINWFSDSQRSPNHLVSSICADSGKLSGLSGVILGTVVSAATSVLGGMILAHAVAWKIAIVLFACVPVMLLSGFLRFKVLAITEDRHQRAYNDAAALASEACNNIRTVAALGIEDQILSRFKAALELPYRQSIRFTLFGNILLAFSLAIPYFVYALAYWWGSRLVRKGEYSTLQFFIVLPALLFSAQAAGMMFSLGPELTQAAAAAQRMFTLLDSKPTIMQTDTALSSQSTLATSSEDELKCKDDHITFSRVTLSYPTRPSIPVLSNISLSIPRGSCTALVGQSGGGKSSIVALLERFYDPTNGDVSVDGVDIRSISVVKHRARLGLVLQESELFTGSISFNVSIGARPGQNPGHDDIVQACKKCGLHDFIMSLPDGYNTECGHKGSTLSGGQKQRLAIARALIRDPEILILDEATSQLDAQSELEVRKAIAEARTGRTVIMIAHRLASIQHADMIHVFERGRILESGTHYELVRKQGIYAGMVKIQDLG